MNVTRNRDTLLKSLQRNDPAARILCEHNGRYRVQIHGKSWIVVGGDAESPSMIATRSACTDCFREGR